MNGCVDGKEWAETANRCREGGNGSFSKLLQTFRSSVVV